MKTLIVIIVTLTSFFTNAASINCIGGASIKVKEGKFAGYGTGHLITQIPVSFKDLARFENAREGNVITTVYIDGIDYSIIKGNDFSSVDVVGIMVTGSVTAVYTPGLCSIEL